MEETGNTQTLNIYGPGGVIIAQVATDSPAGGTPTTQTRYLLHDHLGSTRVVLDSNNQVLGSFDYAPFGETTVTNSGSHSVEPVAYRYTGQEVNGALGTYNYHARQYDTGVGRFLSVDPARYNESPYIYANDNPVNFVDRTGRHPVLWLASADIMAEERTARVLLDLFSTIATSPNTPSLHFGTIETLGLTSRPQGDFSLFLDAHALSRGFMLLTDEGQGLQRLSIGPELMARTVQFRLIAENLQPESLKSTFLTACHGACERNGISLAERFFRGGLERFPNLERVFASPYKLAISGRNGGGTILGFGIEVAPNQRIVGRTTYSAAQFMRHNIDDAALRANMKFRYHHRDQNGIWQYGEQVPDTHPSIPEWFREPLIRTYTRVQVEQRSTLREQPFFSEAALP